MATSRQSQSQELTVGIGLKADIEEQIAPHRDGAEIERDIMAFARFPNGGLIGTGSGSSNTHRELIITLAARDKLPAAYFQRFFAGSGGLVSYGVDNIDPYRRAAGYVDLNPSRREAYYSAGAGADQEPTRNQP